jgi:hypothetical protein
MKTGTVNNIESYISYDFKHANTDIDYENAYFNIHKERVLKDISTDTFIEDLFSDSRPNADNNEAIQNNKDREKNRFNFLAYVYTYLNLKVKLELPRKLSEENIILKSGEDVYFLFKGGNMMYFKYEELKKQVKLNLQDTFFKEFDQNFKISDFDFTCYITVKDRERFYKVKKAVSQILWKETLVIRDFFEKYLKCVLNVETTQETFYSQESPNEQSINVIKQKLFPDMNIFESADDVVNKAMQLNEVIKDTVTLDFQQVHSTLYYLRALLYRETIYHKTPQKVSKVFDDEYKKVNENMKNVITLMWERKISKYITEYITNIKIDEKKRFIEIVKTNHIQTLFVVHEIMVNLMKYKNTIFNKPIDDSVLNKQTNDIYGFLQTFTEQFALIFQNKIVDSRFYSASTASTLIKNIKKKLDEKKDTLIVCETIYDEYLSFEGDVKKLKDENNYNKIELAGKELEVYMQKREDFYVQPSLLDSSTTYTDTSKSNFHYVYLNSTIKKHRNQSSSVVDFDLLRVKFNVNLKIGGDNGKAVKVPSEFIDISICNFDDSSLIEFRSHTEEGLGLFTINNDNLTLECYGYSIEFMVHDLVHVLYEQNLFTPWADAKYKKRIQRLNALQMLSYIGNEDYMRLYLLSLLIVYIIISYSEIYVEGAGKINTNEDMDRLFNNAKDNIVLNFRKYNLERVFNILPTSMLDVIYRTYLKDYKNFSIPYPDQIIGSIVFYSILQSHYGKETKGTDEEKKNRAEVRDIINRYRQDYLFLPADDDDIKDTINKSNEYVKDMANTFLEMLDLVKNQVKSGGGEPQPIEQPPVEQKEPQLISNLIKKSFTFF